METNGGMARYKRLLAKARAEGTVEIMPRGACGWKEASKATLKQLGLNKKVETLKKDKSKAHQLDKKRGPQVEKETTQENIKDALWNACVAFEKGEVDVSALLKFGVPMDQIHEWYIQEGTAREIKEIRRLNGC